MSEILAKLKELDDKKTIYNIHRCRAGWGIIFYYEDKQKGEDWNTGLSVDHYYNTFEEMVEGEYQKLQSSSESAKGKEAKKE